MGRWMIRQFVHVGGTSLFVGEDVGCIAGEDQGAVGVVGDLRERGLEGDLRRAVYLPAIITDWPDMGLVIHTAGDPMDETVRWTNLSPQEIADRLVQRHGIEVSVTVTRKLLDKHGYRRRKIQKNDHERHPTP